MPNWIDVLKEIDALESQNKDIIKSLDFVRRKYLKKVSEKTGRNTIAYYSGWLHNPKSQDTAVNDKDISGFMLNVHGLDRSKGLDLILHTPGGNIAATEALVSYLKSMFKNDIRAIIPQLSMSAGTMIALSTKEIIMGKHSSLGPIDPQLGGVPCHGVINEFNRARKDIMADPKSAALWQFIIQKYNPTLLGSCDYAIKWSDKLVLGWLKENMCLGKDAVARKILKNFSDHNRQKSHSRHISALQCKKFGVKVIELEADNDLQDLVLTTHHAFMHTFSETFTVKIIENQLGVAYMENIDPPR